MLLGGVGENRYSRISLDVHLGDTEETVCEALGPQTEDEEPVQESESEGQLTEKPGMRSLQGRDLAGECGQHCHRMHRSHTGQQHGLGSRMWALELASLGFSSWLC